MKGKFIVIEGGDGVGKDTQVDLLKQKLGEEQFVFLRDTGSTDIGTALRTIVLHDERVTKEAELFMYLAARSQLLSERILPALENGQHVISLRFALSTLAYQVHGRDRTTDLAFIKEMSRYAIQGIQPDLTIYLDCPPHVAAERMSLQGRVLDRFEKEKMDFHLRVREGYNAHLGELNHVIIDATKSIDEVHRDIIRVVREALG